MKSQDVRCALRGNRSRIPTGSKRKALPAASAIIAALLTVLGCAAGMAQVAAQQIAPPGRLVDVGGFRLHINCAGTGSPTVVLESGEGDFSLVWALVHPEVARFTRVCSYDRAGYAWSDAGPEPRTIAQRVFELHALLAGAGEKGPYVLVGASLGGPMVRTFANTYPSDVSGIVLVDSVHEDGSSFSNNQLVSLRSTAQKGAIPPVQTSLKQDAVAREQLLMRAGKAKFVAGNQRAKLPADLQRIWMLARKQDKYKMAANSEFQLLPEELEKLHGDTVANPQPLGKKPLMVLTRDVAFDRTIQGIAPAELDRDRMSLQAKLAKLSANSRLVAVQGAAHEIHLDHPDAVVAAVHDVVQSVKTAEPLNQPGEH